MTIIDVHEAEPVFSILLARVQAGEEIVIVRDGKPIARLAGLPDRACRQPGTWALDPAWASYRFDPDRFAPMTDAELRDAGWLPE